MRCAEILWAGCALAICTINVAAQYPPAPPAIFNADPHHLWNRTYACLLMRQDNEKVGYGADALDPPLWQGTRYLLTGDSHRDALACLDGFLQSDVEHRYEIH